MRTLILTSIGLSTQAIINAFLNELSKPVSDNRVLIITYARSETEEFYVQESKKEIEKIGLSKITIFNLETPVDTASLGDFDVVYVCGGNTFAILDKLRQTRMDTFITAQVGSGAVYVGVSAGSIIAGPNIEIAGWGSEGDKNEVNLEYLGGLNFTSVVVSPHFHDGVKEELEEYKKQASPNFNIIGIRNDQAVLVKDSTVTVI